MGEGLGAEHRDWRWDVAQLVEYMEYWFYTRANTYYNHPITWWQFADRPLDDVSVDFWSPWGRGSAIDYNEGYRIINYIWNDPNPPWIRYYIWQGVMYGVLWEWIGTGQYWWEYYGVDDATDDMHLRHVHFTFW